MHYQHSYHAGNFGDVFKHVLLCGLLRAQNRKEAPWFYLETHSGAGRYDLSAAAAARTAEYQDGIARLWGLDDAPPPVADYLEIVRRENPGGELRTYPGSPLVVAAIARAQDRLAFCEKIPAVAEALEHTLGRRSRGAVHLRDGYEAHALLPPAEKRGLILVDPPFERRDEFDAVGDFLRQATARFAHGVYAAWYPLKSRYAPERFVRRVVRDCRRPALALALDTGARGEGQMHACGMLVLNPPFGFEAQAREALRYLAPHFAQGPRPKWSVAPAAADN